MTDDRPEPKYGQYAPLPPAAVEPEPAPAAPPVAEPRPVRTGDIVATTLLLLLGVADVVGSLPLFADISSQLTTVYAQLGIGGTSASPLAAPLGIAMNAARVAVIAAVIVVSLVLIQRRRRAFWVPLVGYVLASLIVSVLVLVVMLNDPAYTAWVSNGP